MHLRVLILFCTIILLSSATYEITINYLEYYNLVVQGWVQMDVYSVNDNNKTTFHFTTEFRSLVHIPVFVNEKPCVDHCAYPMAVGEKVSISFFQDVGDFIQLYRQTANDTILYFEGCEQSLDLCRYREQSVYALCICPANTVDVMCLLDSDAINTQCNVTTEASTTVQTSSSLSTSTSSTSPSSSSTSSILSSTPASSSSVSSSTSSSSIDSTSTLHATSIPSTLHAETSLSMLSSTIEFSTIVTTEPIISTQTTEQATLSSTLDPTTLFSTTTVTTPSSSSTSDETKTASSTVLITSTLSTAPTPSKDPDKTTTETLSTATSITSADPSSARTTADEISYLSTSTKESATTPLTTNFMDPTSTMNVYTVRTEPSFVTDTISDTMKPVRSTPQPTITQITIDTSTILQQASTVTIDSSTLTSSIPEDTVEPSTSTTISTTMPQTTVLPSIDPSTIALTTNFPSTYKDCLHAECRITTDTLETSSVSAGSSTQSTVITTSTDVRTTESSSTLVSGTTPLQVTTEESEVITFPTSTTASQSTTEWTTPLLTTSTMATTLEPTSDTTISTIDNSSTPVETSTSVPFSTRVTSHKSTTSDSPSSTIYPTSDPSTYIQTTTDSFPSTEATTLISTVHPTTGRKATTDPTSTFVGTASSEAPTDSPTRSTNYITSSSEVTSTAGQTTTLPAFTTMYSTPATSQSQETTEIISDSVSSISVTTTHDTSTEDLSTKFSTEPPITSTVPVTTIHISTITPTLQSTTSDASSINVPSISTEASTTPEAGASSHFPSTITSTKIQTTDPTSTIIPTSTLSTVYSTLFPTTLRTTSEPTPISTTVETNSFSSTDPTSSHVPSVYSTTTITETTDRTTTSETTSISPSTASRSTPTTSSPTTSTHSTSRTTQKPSTSSIPSTTKTSHPTTKTSTAPITVHRNVTSSTSTGRLTTEETQTTPAVPSLEQLADGGVSQSNVSSVLTDTYTYSQKGSDLQSDEITYITIILNKSSNVQGLKSEDSVNILLNMDSVLNANESAMRASGSSPQNLLAMLPTMVLNTNSTLINYLEGVNLGFTSTAVDCQNSESDNGMLDLGNIFETVSNPTDQGKAINSIFIPLNEICGKASVSHVFFSIYRNKGLFLGSKSFRPYSSSMQLDDMNATIPAEDSLIPKCHRQTSLPPSTPVMSGTLLSNGVSLSTIDTQSVMANLQFNVTGILAPLHGRFRVTWWDTVNLKWSLEELCSETRKGDVITATCSHLTDFTLIIDGAINDPNVCNEALMDVGYAANGISIASLLFLLCVHLLGYIPALVESSFVRYLRGHSMVQRDFVALAYTTVLLLFYIFFTLFSDQKVSGKACETVAAITYALLMASVILTICQALRTVSMFFPIAVRSFMQIILQPHVAITVSILTPFVISLLLLELTSFFRRNDGFCWVRADLILYAVVIPISFLVLNALISTILVGWKLFAAKKKFVSKGKHNDRQLRTKIIAIILMQISLGMPWILQYFTIYSPYATVWHYIFTIVMGSQGTLLTILFFYKRRRIIRSSRYESRRPVVEDNSRNVVNVD